MKKYIGVLTYKDPNDLFSNEPLRSSPMKFWAKNVKKAEAIVRQQASSKYGLMRKDIVDVHVIQDKEANSYDEID